MKKIPDGVYERLTSYLSCLLQLESEGASMIASKNLGELTGINPAQIRRDLAYFGAYGKKSVGYAVPALAREIKKILGTDQQHDICIIGAGNLGAAIANHGVLERHGFRLAAIFDNDPDKVGTCLSDVQVSHIDSLKDTVHDDNIAFAIVAVPADHAQETADLLADAGVRVILNYSSLMVTAPPCVQIYNTDPVKELMVTLRAL